MRPDGTIIPEGEEPAVATPAQPEPAVPAEPDAASGENGSRVVSTSPVVTGADVAPADPSATAPEPAQPDTPAIVTGADVAPEPAASEPAAPVPSVVPRKKPDAPVQVASAPATVTTPVQAQQNDSPLNLTQQPAARQQLRPQLRRLLPAPPAAASRLEPISFR